MKEFCKILREALPEIFGGLVVAAVIAIISTMYGGLGKWVTIAIVLVAILLIMGLLFLLTRLRKTTHNNSVEGTTKNSQKTSKDSALGPENSRLTDVRKPNVREDTITQTARGNGIAQVAGNHSSASVSMLDKEQKRKPHKK